MNKKLFTQAIITEADLDISLSDALKTWWFTKCNTHYRLTHCGYKTLSPLTPNFEFTLLFPPTGRAILQCGKLNCAYFLYTNNKGKAVIYIFGTKIATIIQLYGNIEKYLDTL